MSIFSLTADVPGLGVDEEGLYPFQRAAMRAVAQEAAAAPGKTYVACPYQGARPTRH